MGNDDPGDRGSVIRPNEYGCGGSGNFTISGRHTKETNAKGMVSVIAGI